MRDARRRKLACLSPRQSVRNAPPGEREDMLAMIFNSLAVCDDPTVSGVTFFAADGSPPVYIDAAMARAKPRKQRRH